MQTILSIIGARPQFIKHAPVQLQLQQHFNALTLHTGQHYDANMSQVFFDELEIPAPDYRLEVGGGKPHGEQTGIIMREVEQVCLSLRPDAILIYGDTNTTLAGALVAVKLGIPYMHVEAGIRSFNRQMPEEINRVIADTFSSLLFCPTQEAADNLLKEGIPGDKVFMTGDVMCDLLQKMRPFIRQISQEPYYYVTLHRPYNTDDSIRIARILAVLNQLKYPVLLPLHPRLRSRLLATGIVAGNYANIQFIDPVSYLSSISYQDGAECVITDSSGIQKESYMLQKKCITIRSETEWNGTLTHGWNTLAFEDIEAIPEIVHHMPGQHHESMFGDGRAAEAIVAIIQNWIN